LDHEMSSEEQRIQPRYERLFDQTAEIMFRHDPIGFDFGDNTGE